MKNLIKYFIIFVVFYNGLLAFENIDNSSYINTKNIIYNNIDNTIELGEDSLINIKNTNILLNKGIIDYKNDKIEIFGNLYLYQDENIISANGLVGNIDLTRFKTNKVSYIYNNDLKVDSVEMERNGNEVFFYDNFLTPCELNGFFNCPTWSLKIPKTRYIVDKDQFIHFDSFLQIADKKVFYLPYFSHYGAKADRQKGFLSPTLDYNLLNGATFIKTPYYIPINISTDFTLTPKFELSSSEMQLSENLEFNSVIGSRSSGGTLDLDITTRIDNNQKSFYNSVNILTQQVLNKKNNLQIKALLTNSISKTRSDNEEQLSYFSSYIRSNSFDVYKSDDFLISEITSVTSFDNSQNNLIPYQAPYIRYHNKNNLTDELYLLNDFDFYILERGTSYLKNSKQNIGLNISNEINNIALINQNLIVNKLNLDNSFRSLKFENNQTNKDYTQTNLSLSTNLDIPFYNSNILSKFAIIINEDFDTYKNHTNEDSQSISFSYNHLFKEKRFYGFDLPDNSKRFVYGVEFLGNPKNNKLKLSIGQSYDISKNNDYMKKINQDDNFSDYALNSKANFNNFKLSLDGRFNNKTLTKKEMNYYLTYSKNSFDYSFIYNETSKEAFSSYSDDSKALKTQIDYKINDNIKLSSFANIDLKNEYSPFETNISLSIFDECSQFDINYTNTKYSDNFSTTPKEIISFSFKMDYLGFFGYEQTSNLFFKETGQFNYGAIN